MTNEDKTSPALSPEEIRQRIEAAKLETRKRNRDLFRKIRR